MQQRGAPFVGCLYVGLALTEAGPQAAPGGSPTTVDGAPAADLLHLDIVQVLTGDAADFQRRAAERRRRR